MSIRADSPTTPGLWPPRGRLESVLESRLAAVRPA